MDRDDNIIVSLGETPGTTLPEIDTHPIQVDDGIFDVASIIKIANQPMGQVLMGFSLSLMEEAIVKSRTRGIWIAAIEIILTVAVTVLIGLGLTRRLGTLADAAQEVGAGNYLVSVPLGADDEVSRTASAFNKMVAEISNRSRTLKETRENAHNLLAENRRLIRMSMNVQEEERKHLARELHDELGQCITAIQADAEIIRDFSKGRGDRIED